MLDVDGVLTDGRLYFRPAAKRSRYFTSATATASSCSMAERGSGGGGQRPPLRGGGGAHARTARAHVVQGCSDKVLALHDLDEAA